MALVVKDRVKETTSSTGTGTITLAGAVSGFQSFSVIGNGNTTYYTITDGTNWEVGIGTYTSSGTTLSRDTILESSNGGAAVNFGAGTKDVFVTYPAEKSISDGYGLLPVANGGTGATSLTSGYLVKGNGTSAVTASVVYDDGTNVGIGVTPGAKLDVNGTIWARASAAAIGMDVIGRSADNAGQIRFLNSAASTALATVATYGNDFALLNNTASYSLLLGTNSTERMRITSSGNVGIGTSSPSQKLDVTTAGGDDGIVLNNSSTTGGRIRLNSTGTGGRNYHINSTANGSGDGGGKFIIRDSTASDAARFTIDSSGNVGIGTSSPDAKLEVEGSNNTLRLTNTTASSFAGLEFFDGTNTKGQIWVGNASYASFGGAGSINYSANSGPHVFYTNYSERVRIDSSGNVGIGISSPTSRLTIAGGIAEIRDGQPLMLRPSGNAWDMRLQATGTQLDILSGGALGSPIMSLVHGGNVGIGTSSPSSYGKLTVNGSVILGAPSGRNTAATNYIGTWTTGDPADDARANIGFTTVAGAASSSSYITFATNNYGVSGGERMRIDSSGNVGIGTSSPGYTLDAVSSDTTYGYTARLRANATAGYSRLQFTDSGATAQWATLSANSSTLYVTADGGTMVFQTSGSERARINSSGLVGINTTSTPTYGSAKLVVDGNISGKGTVTVNNSTATTIAEGAGMLLLIRNTTHGGTAVVQYENAQTPIIIATSGGTTFQTGTPSGSAQIQLSNKSGNLGVAALASSDRNGAVLVVTVLQTFS